ncbi:hypothetical protein L6164_029400 [Bauhinia variegata]|uniref:Uncharacterized protein n=1 Tax=Bauhinia variegata TaxID=167791 RepID=A0ACB9L9I9_BAUVA|nr:hypothetical protein L6164_029400 [Bauhinia variegata]
MSRLILASYQNTQGNQGENDPTNTTLFVGNLHPSVSDDLLRQVFGQYGELVHVKIPAGKCRGFVQFANSYGFCISCAEQALSVLNGTPLVGQSIRLSWGRNPSNTQSLIDQILIWFMEVTLNMGITSSLNSERCAEFGSRPILVLLPKQLITLPL